MQLNIDKELSGLIQPLQKEEFDALTESILFEGCRDAIIAWNDTIVDGHNRYKICVENDIDFKVLHMDFDSKQDAMLWMIENQQGRHNLSKVNRGKLVLKKKHIITAMAKKNQGTRTDIPQISAECNEPMETRKILAKEAGISHDTLGKIENVEITGVESLKDLYSKTDSDVSVNLANKVINLPDEEQEEFVERVEDGEKPTDVFYEIKIKNEPPREVIPGKGNFERLSDHCMAFTEGIQMWADGMMIPEGRREASEAATVLDSAPNIIMQFVRLGVDIEWCYKVAKGDENARLEGTGTERDGGSSNEIIDVMVD